MTFQISPQDAVASAFMAVLGRAPEYSAMAYYVARYEGYVGDDSSLTLSLLVREIQATAVVLEEIVDSEAQNIAIVRGLYEQLLGREAEPVGQSYWVEALTSGKLTLESIVTAFVGAVLDPTNVDDGAALMNRLTVSKLFALEENSGPAVLGSLTVDAAAILAGVTNDPATVDKATGSLHTPPVPTGPPVEPPVPPSPQPPIEPPVLPPVIPPATSLKLDVRTEDVLTRDLGGTVTTVTLDGTSQGASNATVTLTQASALKSLSVHELHNGQLLVQGSKAATIDLHLSTGQHVDFALTRSADAPWLQTLNIGASHVFGTDVTPTSLRFASDAALNAAAHATTLQVSPESPFTWMSLDLADAQSLQGSVLQTIRIGGLPIEEDSYLPSSGFGGVELTGLTLDGELKVAQVPGTFTHLTLDASIDNTRAGSTPWDYSAGKVLIANTGGSALDIGASLLHEGMFLRSGPLPGALGLGRDAYLAWQAHSDSGMNVGTLDGFTALILTSALADGDVIWANSSLYGSTFSSLELAGGVAQGARADVHVVAEDRAVWVDGNLSGSSRTGWLTTLVAADQGELRVHSADAGGLQTLSLSATLDAASRVGDDAPSSLDVRVFAEVDELVFSTFVADREVARMDDASHQAVTLDLDNFVGLETLGLNLLELPDTFDLNVSVGAANTLQTVHASSASAWAQGHVSLDAVEHTTGLVIDASQLASFAYAGSVGGESDTFIIAARTFFTGNSYPAPGDTRASFQGSSEGDQFILRFSATEDIVWRGSESLVKQPTSSWTEAREQAVSALGKGEAGWFEFESTLTIVARASDVWKTSEPDDEVSAWDSALTVVLEGVSLDDLSVNQGTYDGRYWESEPFEIWNQLEITLTPDLL